MRRLAIAVLAVLGLVVATEAALGTEGQTMAMYSVDGTSVMASSDKELSNVVLHFCDGKMQKFDELSGYSGTFRGTGSNSGKRLNGSWIKSGDNHSGDGAGYGTWHPNPIECPNPPPPLCIPPAVPTPVDDDGDGVPDRVVCAEPL